MSNPHPIRVSRGARCIRHFFMPALTAAVVLGCAGGGLSPSEQSGFLGSNAYDRLQKVESPAPGVNIYRYISPDFRRSDYKGVMIDPVTLYQTVVKSEGNKGISEETIYQTRTIIDDSIRSTAAHRFHVVDKPGPGVARISIAITGAEVAGEGFKPRNLVPVSAVLTVAQKATGLDSKTAVLVVEAKLRDSVTGKLLGEGVYTMSSDTFRMESSTPEQFQMLAAAWVNTAVRVAAGMAGN